MDRKHQRGSKIPGLIIFFLLVSGTFAAKKSETESISQYDREISRKSGTLDSIKIELEKGRAKLSELQNQEGNYLGRLEQLEKNINFSKAYLEIARAKIDTLEMSISRLSDSLVWEQKKLVDRRGIMRKRLRQAYMAGNPDPLRILLESKSPLDAVNRTRYLEELNRYDRGLLKDIENSRKEIDIRKSTEELERKKLAQYLEDKKQEQQTLLNEESQRKSMLEEVRTKKKIYSELVSELEASQKELNKMIELLERKRIKEKKHATEQKSTLAFEKKKGKLPWPVNGAVIAKFGKVIHPVYKTVVMNNGIDIGSKNGQDIVCVSKGTVVHVGWMRGLGKMVIVDHTGGYITIYAHLEDILVNQDDEVDGGTIIGRVGEIGSSSGALLHFEIRKSTESLNPLDWLE